MPSEPELSARRLPETSFNIDNILSLEFYSEDPLTEDSKANLQDWLLPELKPLVKLLFGHIPVSPAIVERICVVEPAILGEIIFQTQAEKNLKPDYTGQTGYYHTAAKTISYLNVEGKLQSTIICNLRFFSATVDALAKDMPYDEWNAEDQLAYYVLAHEYGHAFDSWTRKDVSADTLFDPEETNWEEIAKVSAPIVFNEYLACLIASPAVTPKLQAFMLKMLDDDLENFNNVLVRKRNSFCTDWGEVAHCYWTILIQLAKVIGHDDETLPPIILGKDDDENDDTKKSLELLIADFAAALNELKESYPDLPADQIVTEKLSPYFLRLAGIYKFFFREQDVPSEINAEHG